MSMWRGLCFLSCLLLGAGAVWGETAAEEVEPAEIIVLDVPQEAVEDLDAPLAPPLPMASFQEIWTYPPVVHQGDEIQIETAFAPAYPAAVPVPLEVTVHSEGDHYSAYAELSVRTDEGVVVNEGQLPLTLVNGQNHVRFNWDASAAPTRNYILRLAVFYLSDEPPAWIEVPLKKVTDLQLKQDLHAVTIDLSLLREQLTVMAERGALPPYQHVRMVISRDYLALARRDREEAEWRQLDAKLAYLLDVAQAMRAALALGSVAPELQEQIPRPPLAGLDVIDGSYWVGGRPIFLFGQTLSSPDAAAVQALPRLGMNFAALDFGPERTQSAPSSQAAEALRDVFAAAQEANVSVELRLAPHEVNGAVLASNPQVALEDGTIDIASDPARLAYQRHVQALAPVLSGQPMLNSVSLAEDPWFHFRGEKVRQLFIEFARELYPTRHALNQSWRSHLGSYEEIRIEEGEGYDLYLEKRAYQADWQTFKRMLGLRYLNWAANLVHEHAPGVPLQVTMGNGLFELGEARRGVDREMLTEIFPYSGCSTTTESDDPIYAYHYPHQSAYYALLKSLAPDKPVLNSENYFVVDASRSPDERFHYVRAAVWEAFVSGLSAMAVPDNSPLFAYPETLEAYATAALDVNRLAPIVHALQQAPAPVAVLWSDSSKVFDDGEPYLESALYAYEGCSFGGYNVRWISEEQCAAGGLADVKLLVIPHTPAVTDAAFEAMKEYAEKGGVIARIGMPIPYNEKGHSRQDILPNSYNTILVRGVNLPTEYLHAVDAAIEMDALPMISRPVNEPGYPLEGVRSRTVELDGQQYMYIVNVRKEPVVCHLTGASQSGRDLIQGRDVDFPRLLAPLQPMLLLMNRPEPELTLTAPPVPLAAVSAD